MSFGTCRTPPSQIYSMVSHENQPSVQRNPEKFKETVTMPHFAAEITAGQPYLVRVQREPIVSCKFPDHFV